MRSLTKGAVGALAVAVAASILGAPAATARVTADRSAHPDSVPCQSNLNYAYDTGMAALTQKFPPPTTLDSVGASNFMVPASGSCTVNYLTVFGRSSGPTPFRVNIAIKADGTTVSGMHKPTGPNLAPGNTNLIPTPLTSPAGYYNMTTNLAAPVTLTAPASGPVRYWVLFQVKFKKKKVGKWAWEIVQPDPTGEGDVWTNPGGGFGCGTGWVAVSNACLGGAPGKGFMMEIGT